jgi:hypothetical protein
MSFFFLLLTQHFATDLHGNPGYVPHISLAPTPTLSVHMSPQLHTIEQGNKGDSGITTMIQILARIKIEWAIPSLMPRANVHDYFEDENGVNFHRQRDIDHQECPSRALLQEHF